MILRVLVFLSGLALAASAQNARKLSARTLCFSYVDQVESVFAPTGKDGEMSEVPLYTTVISEPFEMNASAEGGVFSLPNDDPEQPYKPLKAAALPSGSSVLFLFLPAPEKSKDPYKVVALADDTRSFPWGSVRLLNLSPHAVRFHLGEHNGQKAFGLLPGKSELVKTIQRLDDFNRYPVLVDYKTDKGFEPFYNNAWRAVAEKRDLVITYQDPNTGLPHLNHYEDAKPAELGPTR